MRLRRMFGMEKSYALAFRYLNMRFRFLQFPRYYFNFSLVHDELDFSILDPTGQRIVHAGELTQHALN